MGTIYAKTIIDDAAKILHDIGFDRWKEVDLFAGINRGQKEIVFYKPDANSDLVKVILVAGTVQPIPTDAYQLIAVLRNMGTDGNTPGLAPRLVEIDAMNEYHPYWHSEEPDAEVDYYMVDERDMTRFLVSPPQPSSNFGQLEISVSKAPANIVPLAGPDYNVPININDIYENVLLYYALFFAFSKDADFSMSSAQRSQAFYNLFLTTVGRKDLVEGEVASEPKAKYSD